jgi:sulfite exporter TauE/SafE
MGLGTSLFLIAVGAILDFAVSVNTQGFNIHTIGVILMVVGAIGVVLSLIFWSSWGGFNRGDSVVVDDRPRRVL